MGQPKKSPPKTYIKDYKPSKIDIESFAMLAEAKRRANGTYSDIRKKVMNDDAAKNDSRRLQKVKPASRERTVDN